MTDGPTLGGLDIVQPKNIVRRMAILLWASSGDGKTTLASTAPGKKLWVSFDPDATACLGPRDDIVEVKLYDQPARIVEKFKDENGPFFRDLSKMLSEDDSIATVVVDSITTFRDKAMTHGVLVAQGTNKGKSSTLEDPGYAGYGNLNTWTRLFVANMLAVTAKHNRHVVLVAHEDKPTTNSDGVVLFISIMLGSSLNVQVPVNITEVWHMQDTGKERRIQIRPCRGFKPMKTRMFRTTGAPEFVWDYNDETKEGEGIATWYNRWKKAKFAKIPLPSG